MALVMSPWFGRGCGRRGSRPFSFGSPSLFSDLVIVKVPVMQQHRQPAAAANCGPAMSNARVVQWSDTPEGHTFKLRLPGLKKEDLQIQVEDDRTLYIKYSNEPKAAAKDGDAAATAATATDAQPQAQKRSSSGTSSGTSFMRKFKLPETADLEQITAEVTNETLTVSVPKLKQVPASQPRQIHISDAPVSAASPSSPSPSSQESGKVAEKGEAKASSSTA